MMPTHSTLPHNMLAGSHTDLPLQHKVLQTVPPDHRRRSRKVHCTSNSLQLMVCRPLLGDLRHQAFSKGLISVQAMEETAWTEAISKDLISAQTMEETATIEETA